MYRYTPLQGFKISVCGCRLPNGPTEFKKVLAGYCLVKTILVNRIGVCVHLEKVYHSVATHPHVVDSRTLRSSKKESRAGNVVIAIVSVIDGLLG